MWRVPPDCLISPPALPTSWCGRGDAPRRPANRLGGPMKRAHREGVSVRPTFSRDGKRIASVLLTTPRYGMLDAGHRPIRSASLDDRATRTARTSCV